MELGNGLGEGLPEARQAEDALWETQPRQGQRRLVPVHGHGRHQLLEQDERGIPVPVPGWLVAELAAEVEPGPGRRSHAQLIDRAAIEEDLTAGSLGRLPAGEAHFVPPQRGQGGLVVGMILLPEHLQRRA